MKDGFIKERLDKLILEKGIIDTRERAKAYIIGGSIKVNGETIKKPSALVDVNSEIKLKLLNKGYVSRGGVKLEGAISDFNLKIKDRICLDIGASTGGFTDCLLKSGAKCVTAIDVGRNQIAYRLRNNPQVHIIENFNARYIDQLKIDKNPDLVTIDVSFISLKLILTPLYITIAYSTDVIALIKPQFELKRPYLGFKGVIKDKKIHFHVLYDLNNYFLNEGYTVKGYTFSKIKGPRGNIEYFVNLIKEKNIKIRNNRWEKIIDELVTKSHMYFNKIKEEKHD